MIRRGFLLLPVVLGMLAAACQRIPPEVSIADYAEKKAAAAEQNDAGGSLGAAENPPAFFRNQYE